MGRTAAKAALPLFVWLGVMMTLTSIPGHAVPTPITFSHWDKLAHFAGYLVLSILLFRFIRWRSPTAFTGPVLLMILIGAGYALLDEIHQIPIPNRQCSWQDLAANLAGIGVCAAIVYAFFRPGRSLSSIDSHRL